jgi:hypothetical protein
VADTRDEVGLRGIDLNDLLCGMPLPRHDTVLGMALRRASLERAEPGTVIAGFDNKLSES